MILLLLMAVASCRGWEELSRPSFCSTCFTTTQAQNYHCCFYFFKCCAEARLGSRSTTPHPGLPFPGGGATFFVRNGDARPCSSADCADASHRISDLCCRTAAQGGEEKERRRPLFHVPSLVSETEGDDRQERGWHTRDILEQ